MKTKILLIFLFYSANFLIAQNNKKITDSVNQVVIYDFAAQKYVNEIIPKRGKKVIFKIININPFFYKVTTTPHDIEFNANNLPEAPKTKTNENENASTLPAKKELEGVKADDLLKVSNKDLKVNDTNISNVKNKEIKNIDDEITKIDSEKIKFQDQKNNLNSEKEKKLKEIEALEKLIQNINEKSIKDGKAKDSIASNNLKIGVIINEKKHIEDKIEHINTLINATNNDIDLLTQQKVKLSNESMTKDKLLNTINSILFRLNSNYDKFYDYSSYLVHLNENYQNFIDKIADPSLTKEEFELIRNGNGIEKVSLLSKENFPKFYERINWYEVYRDNVEQIFDDNNLIESINILKTIKSANNKAEQLELSLNEKKKNFKTIIDKVSNFELRRKLNYVETLNRKLQEEETYEISSIPVQPWGDLLEFDVQILQRKQLGDTFYLPTNTKNFKFSEYVKNGIRFDFSLGTVFDFGLKENNYEIVDTDNNGNNGYIIKQLTNNKYTPIIAAMFHSSIRSHSLCSVAFTLGVSVDPSKLQIESLFPGLSLMIGKKDKIVFTAGPSLRKINELNTVKYQQDTFLGTKPTDYMIESYKVGAFIGVSWSLTNNQKNIINPNK